MKIKMKKKNLYTVGESERAGNKIATGHKTKPIHNINYCKYTTVFSIDNGK